jgi:hypothetical protein
MSVVDSDNKKDMQPLETICICNTCDHNDTSEYVKSDCTCCFEVCEAMMR